MSRNLSSEDVRRDFIDSFPNQSGELAYYLWNDISLLHMNWNAYRDLFASDVETIDLLNSIAPVFFAMSERTIRRDTLLRICRIMDPANFAGDESKPNASLTQLFDRVSGEMSEQVLEEIQLGLSELLTLSKPIRDLRNKRYAHSDLEVVLELRDEPLPGVSRALIEDVLAGIRNLFNTIQAQFNKSHTSFENVVTSQSTKTLLFHLQRAMAFQEIEKLVLEGRFGQS
jgi:hypothetical protein